MMGHESTHMLVDLSGTEVLPGDVIVSFRGETWVFDRVTRPPGPSNSAMIRVRPPGHDEDGFAREFFLDVFPGFVVRPQAVASGGGELMEYHRATIAAMSAAEGLTVAELQGARADARAAFLHFDKQVVLRGGRALGGGGGEALADLRAALELFAPLRAALETPSSIAQLNKISRKVRDAYDQLAADRDDDGVKERGLS